jgi:hypothetical protein
MIPLGILGNRRGAPAAAGAYELISTTTLSSTATSITLSSIPSTYKHLQIRMVAQSTRPSVQDDNYMEFNGNTTSTNYYSHRLAADGSSVYSATNANLLNLGPIAGNSNANIFGVKIIDILDYANTSKNTTVRAVSGNPNTTGGAERIGLYSGVFNNTAAITSILFYNSNNPFASKTRVSLYGIKG